MIYLNTKTNEYPRHVGDLELLGWKLGDSLPENWVEVEYTEPPAVEEGQTCDQLAPTQDEDGIWRIHWSEVRPLNSAELALKEKMLRLITDSQTYRGLNG
jgi:hypothetical protein